MEHVTLDADAALMGIRPTEEKRDARDEKRYAEKDMEHKYGLILDLLE